MCVIVDVVVYLIFMEGVSGHCCQSYKLFFVEYERKAKIYRKYYEYVTKHFKHFHLFYVIFQESVFH